MKKGKIIRKSYLPGLLLSALGIFAFGVIVSAVFLYLDIYRPLDTHYGAVLSIITDIKETLILKTLRISGISSLFTALGLLALVILYTHRIAGPLYRIKVSAMAIGEGRLGTKVKFRRNDVIHPFAESLNEMTGNYSERVATLSSEIRQLKGAVEELKTLTEQGQDTEAVLKKALDKDSQIKGLLNNIKL